MIDDRIMTNKKKLTKVDRFKYEIIVNEWHPEILFNDAMYQSVLDDREFEERISIIMIGNLKSTTSKKCKKVVASTITLSPNDNWYNRDMIREDLHTIGYMNLERADTEIYQEDTICFWVSIPTKSFELIKHFVSYSGKGRFTIMGTDLSYRKGDIYSLRFE